MHSFIFNKTSELQYNVSNRLTTLHIIIRKLCMFILVTMEMEKFYNSFTILTSNKLEF